MFVQLSQLFLEKGIFLLIYLPFYHIKNELAQENERTSLSLRRNICRYLMKDFIHDIQIVLKPNDKKMSNLIQTMGRRPEKTPFLEDMQMENK
jgi:hypothetical protein